MFRYFPTNYPWNLSVDLAIEMGAKMGEIEEMCAPLMEASKKRDAEGTVAFRETWARMADKLCDLAAEDETKGRLISAGEKYNRPPSVYRPMVQRVVWRYLPVFWKCLTAVPS